MGSPVDTAGGGGETVERRGRKAQEESWYLCTKGLKYGWYSAGVAEWIPGEKEKGSGQEGCFWTEASCKPAEKQDEFPIDVATWLTRPH